ncbi:hypothetical protein [Halobacillus sp. A5]|uniref:hypothetical protein n=1 Tax=Halobacillus sp. A5 TaxID=2880263 RepID=UPI0020A689D4|nr:hypothetical protein [Halobacillus sp. A5]MCP3026899.1 hypothetical protein [Halobacillus sp. A5]
MKLYKGNAVKRVEKLLTNGEKRKEKLQTKLKDLRDEHKNLYEAEQDDLNLAIIEGGEPTKKLTTDRKKVEEEIKDVQETLSKVDTAIQSELEKAKKEVEEERKQFVKDAGEDFYKLYDELNAIKIQYLEKLVEYAEKKSEFTKDYNKTFNNVRNTLGLSYKNPRDFYELSLSRRYQSRDRNYYTPIVLPDELSTALHDKKVSSITLENKETFKK